MEKKTTGVDRARQFMPFAALRGFEELIREKERIPEKRRVLSEEDAAALSENLRKTEVGMMAKVRYYDGTGYRETVGMVSDIDFANRWLRIVKAAIRFDDISDIRIIEKEE